ncbi:MAG TPA: AAA family ATPase [Candidatus Absconditabacterales bacterium]|nr:AAA family ATPase [Candidatus Absconditabacterales bacterium]
MNALLFLSLLIAGLAFLLWYFWTQKDSLVEGDSPLDQKKLLGAMKKSSLDTSFFQAGLAGIDIIEPEFVKIKKEIQKKIVGMEDFLHTIMVSLLSGGHLLVEGAPGLAKTKTIQTISDIVAMDFKRIQFTPDMLPADIIGVEVFNSKIKDFEIKLGPIVGNIILADEINRTTPKVQSALLESMQEKQITIGGSTYLLPDPFFVLATQNPLEQEGTFPLPEAQLDRFMFKVLVDYPTVADEQKIISLMEQDSTVSVKKMISPATFSQLRRESQSVIVADSLKDYIARLVTATRETNSYLLYGASPRASLSLLFGAKSLAYLQGREFATHEDVQRIALSVMRHRVGLSYEAQAEGISVDHVLLNIFSGVTLE